MGIRKRTRLVRALSCLPGSALDVHTGDGYAKKAPKARFFRAESIHTKKKGAAAH